MLVKFDQGNLNRHHRRLNDDSVIHSRLVRVFTQFVQLRPASQLMKQRVDFFHPVPKHRFALHQLQPHAGPLTALAREHKRELRPILPHDFRGEHGRIDQSVGEAAKCRCDFIRRLSNNRQDMLVVAASSERGTRNVLKAVSRGAEIVSMPCCQGPQRITVKRAEHVQRRAGCCGLVRPLNVFSLSRL